MSTNLIFFFAYTYTFRCIYVRLGMFEMHNI